MKDERWVFYDDVVSEDMGGGVVRRVLAYSDDIMVVENTFTENAVGKMHSHPHTQITYVKSGRFRFTIGDTTREVSEGDTLLKKNGVPHGCVCLEAGVLLDVFSPYRQDFVND
ncbi:MAG: cupin domain-containing protein [Lachnospiraceae bacterium]|nr:cupin domain-containing protein [Lachnospiraceae bacterium]